MQTTTELTPNPLRGIGLKVISVSIFVVMAVCIKSAAPNVPPGEAVFFRSIFAVPVIVAWLMWQHDLRHGLDTSNPFGHLWRGLVGSAAMALNFTALGLLPLPEATALGYTAPLLVVIFAAMFLGEQVRLFRLTAVFIGLIGVMIVLAPRMQILSFEEASKLQTIGAMAALMGAVFAALAQVFVRKLVQSESTAAIVFYFSINASVLSLFTVPFGWVMPNPVDFALLVCAGLCGGVGQILLTSAYRFAPVGVIAPFEYVSMILALVIGYALFDEIPTLPMLAGAGLIVFAGLFIIWRERQLGLQRGSRKHLTPQG
ncbi:DMT family transporter [Amaricoccus tamworthensis]|uniref:DMT family transporter n=1 Tax=Amaricoccus tamworthensis TaxID=57002 RepID=UPI003C7E7B48